MWKRQENSMEKRENALLRTFLPHFRLISLGQIHHICQFSAFQIADDLFCNIHHILFMSIRHLHSLMGR